MKMDVSKFKKVSADDKKTVLMHPSGHKIVIAHGALSPSLKSGLDKIPLHFDGGGIVEQAGSNKTPAGASQYVGAPDTDQIIEQADDNRTVQRQPNALQRVAPSSIPVSDDEPVQAASHKFTANVPPLGDKAEEYKKAISQYPIPKEQQDVASDQSQSQLGAPEPSIVPEDTGQIPTQDVDQNNYNKGFADYKQEHAYGIGKEDAAFQQDLTNGHITPETYSSLFAKKDTLGKIGTLFGMLVSGAGSGLSHQPNAVMQMMQNEIANDLDAQKQSKNNAHTLWGIRQKQQLTNAQVGQYGAETEKAQAQTKAEQIKADTLGDALDIMRGNRVALAHAAQIAQNAPPGPMREAAQKTLMGMGQAVDAQNYNIGDVAASKMALLDSLPGGSNQQGGVNTMALRVMGNKDLAKDVEDKTIPGFSGMASAAMDPNEKKELNRYVQFDQQLGRFRDWAAQHSGILPDSAQNIATIKQGQSLAKAAQAKYRESQLNTVYRPGEQPLLDQTIDPEPTKFLNKWRVIPQLDALRKENMDQLNTAAQTYGFKGYQGNQQAPAAQPKQQATPTTGMTTVIDPNGQRWNMPKANLQKALSRGYKVAQ